MACHVSFPFPICLQRDNKKIVFRHGIQHIVYHRVTIPESDKREERKSYPAEMYGFNASQQHTAEESCDSGWNGTVTDLK